MKICFMIGSPDISGGTYVIFEHAVFLQNSGLDVVILPIWAPDRSRPAWHPALDKLRFVTLEEAKADHYDLAIATWWRTLYDLMPQVDADRFCYFVQSIESWFYPDTDVAVRNLVNATYLMPLPGITEARWIREHLKRRFGHDYLLAPNGCRKDFYRAEGPLALPKRAGELRVLVEGPLGVDFKNVARSIELLRQSRADEIVLLTLSDIGSFPGVSKVFSRVPTAECGAIYRSCDVLVKLSTIEGMFGPPLEMFHCGGTAVVYDVTGHDEYIAHEVNALVVPMGEEAGVVAAVNRLKDNPALLDQLRQGAGETARRWPDWPAASAVFARHVRSLLSGPPMDAGPTKLMIAEFWAQYLRTEAALLGAGGREKAALGALAKRLPGVARLAKSIRARYAEGRRPPVNRTQI